MQVKGGVLEKTGVKGGRRALQNSEDNKVRNASPVQSQSASSKRRNAGNCSRCVLMSFI